MTPQEAIDVLKKNYPSECFEDLREAVDEAITALEFKERIEECEKKYCPGKQKAIDAFREFLYRNGIDGYTDDELWETILYKWRFEDADKRTPGSYLLSIT